ncbi:twin-arginine translocase subunit TatC [Candidatus Woesearchaeota archaeon]|nr:twin-arginine translocase subunit TatC [Candidatus Woesearchaeota archaeon]
MELISHIKEFRQRFVKVIFIFSIFFSTAYFLSPKIINVITATLPPKVRLISTYPMESLYSQIKIAMYISFLLTLPYLLFQIIEFIRPALKKQEKKFINLFYLGLFLFYTGCVFGFIFLYVFGIYFLSELSISMSIGNLWSLEKTISFLFTVCFLLGVCFQLPLLILILNRLKIFDKKFLKEKRKQIYIAILITAAVITPTGDPFIMIIVTIPLIFLYELSLWLIN